MRIRITTLAAVLASTLLAACDRNIAVDYTPGPVAEWGAYGAAPGGGHYSAADQITRDNVHALEQAWVYRSGDMREPGPGEIGGQKMPMLPGSSWQMTPILVGDTLYGCSAFNRMFALDPSTGAEKWSYDPGVDISQEIMVNCRGVSSWQSPAPTGAACDHRIIMGTLDGRLVAVDAKDGKPCDDFGEHGQVSLREGLGEFAEQEYSVTSPPAILGDRIITGAMVLDRTHNHMPSGVVRAYNVRTGALEWFWDPIPPGQKPEFDAEGKPVFRRGTTNVWSVISVDPERKLVFLPTGNTSTDFFGGLRDNMDYYSSSVVALKGDTGELAWHFQMVHHDIWDYDTPAQPTLFELERDGRTIPALAQPTKMGHLFILNRETGEPLFPVEERPVPQDWEVPGEYLAPTQPFPVKPAPLHPGRPHGGRRLGLHVLGSRRLPQADRGAAQRRHLHAALGAGLGLLPQRLRRQQLGHAGDRPRAQADHPEHDVHALAAATDPARAVQARCRRRVHRAAVRHPVLPAGEADAVAAGRALHRAALGHADCHRLHHRRQALGGAARQPRGNGAVAAVAADQGRAQHRRSQRHRGRADVHRLHARLLPARLRQRDRRGTVEGQAADRRTRHADGLSLLRSTSASTW